jgi:hypothetical protein
VADDSGAVLLRLLRSCLMALSSDALKVFTQMTSPFNDGGRWFDAARGECE